MSLPAGADEDDITATYDKGISTVSVPLLETEPSEKHVEVYEIAPLDEDDDDDDGIEDDGIEDEGDALAGQSRATISHHTTRAPDRLPSMGWKPPNSSPCCRDAG